MLILPAMPATGERPALYKLGETRAEINIDTLEENRNAALSLAKQANYHINIFTQDLDAPLYDNHEFEAHLARLARKHPNTRIRILVQDSMTAVKRGHCLIHLAQNMTSSVFIRKPAKPYQNEQASFLVADGLGLLYRVVGSQMNYDAQVSFMSPLRARKLNEFFDEVWEQSAPDPQVRRLYM